LLLACFGASASRTARFFCIRNALVGPMLTAPSDALHKNTAARRAPAGLPSTATARCRTASTRPSSSPVRLGWELELRDWGACYENSFSYIPPPPHTHPQNNTHKQTPKTVACKQGSPA
jgi:hypothetical protein